MLNLGLVRLGSVKKANVKFKPYPRPGQDNDKNEKKLGKGAVPVTDLREWIKEKQEHGRR